MQRASGTNIITTINITFVLTLSINKLIPGNTLAGAKLAVRRTRGSDEREAPLIQFCKNNKNKLEHSNHKKLGRNTNRFLNKIPMVGRGKIEVQQETFSPIYFIL